MNLERNREDSSDFLIGTTIPVGRGEERDQGIGVGLEHQRVEIELIEKK